MSQRTDRVDELLRQEIGQALEREVADPAIGFVTVTDVETSPDLQHARVWVSVIGDETRRKEALAALRRAMPYVRHTIAPRLRMRRIPELDVRLDDSAQRGTRVLHIIEELEAGRVPEDGGTAGESLPTPVPRIRQEDDAPEPVPPPAETRLPDENPAARRSGRTFRARGSERGSDRRRPQARKRP